MVAEPTAAVILTHNRPELLAECVASIRPQVDVVLVIDNASDPPTPDLDPSDDGLWQTVDPDQPPNLSRLWNFALDTFTEQRHPPRYVAFLCDDTTTPDGWMTAVIEAMQATGAVAGCSNPWGHQHPPRVKTEFDFDIMGRMPGWAFVLDTKAGLRADETMHWWWLDSDIDMQARRAGGMVMIGVPGLQVPNHRPGEYTNSKPELGEQAGRDGQAFAAKWGRTPW